MNMKHLKLYPQWGNTTRCYENFDFNEDDFDFEEEQPSDHEDFKKGDKVTIGTNLKEYIFKHKWPDEMYNFIGKIYTFDYIEDNNYYEHNQWSKYWLNGHSYKYKAYLNQIKDYYFPLETIIKI